MCCIDQLKPQSLAAPRGVDGIPPGAVAPSGHRAQSERHISQPETSMKTIRALIPAAMAVWACSSIWAADALADCDAKAKQSTPTTQFKFLSGGISVLDTKTGLEWQRCPEGMMFAAGKAVDRSLDSCMGTASTFNPTTIK